MEKIQTKEPYLIIDGFLSKRYFDAILSEITNIDFPWYYRGDITNLNRHNKSTVWSQKAALQQNYSYGFEHSITDRSGAKLSPMYDILQGFYNDLLDLTGGKSLAKSRIDMTTYSPDGYVHTPHVDLYEPHLASVFYFTDSDADTIIYDQKVYTYETYIEEINFDELVELKRVQPQANRLLIFEGEYLHTGSSPVEYKNRMILNTDIRV